MDVSTDMSEEELKEMDELESSIDEVD